MVASPNSTRRPPLIVLGIDAGDPGFIEKWAREGHLPAIASVMARGRWGLTGGPELVSEHGVWVSLLSGVSRADHGYYYFRELEPGTYDLRTRTGLDVDAPPFWSRFVGSDRTVATIDVPDAVPIRGLPGIQLANWATHNNWNPDAFPTASEPPEILARIRRDFGAKLVTLEDAEASPRKDKRLHKQLIEQTEKKGALCRHLLGQTSFDLIVSVFSASHAANHQFWKYRPELQNGASDGDTAMTHAIRDVYQAIDREIGQLLEQLPRESNVVIISSVGMEDDYPTTGLIEAFCRQLGYQASPASGKIPLRPMDVARRIVPESWRIRMSRGLSREARERLLADQFRSGTDWSKTTAFTLPASYTSFIRVNLRGREPLGIVEPGSEYRQLLDRIETDLRELTDPATGAHVVTKITRTVDAFGCDPHPSLPDLFVEWLPGKFLEWVIHPTVELVQGKPDFFRRSDHSSHGFVAAAGPSIRPGGVLGDVEVLDLAPTFLTLMGETPARHMSGRALSDILM